MRAAYFLIVVCIELSIIRYLSTECFSSSSGLADLLTCILVKALNCVGKGAQPGLANKLCLHFVERIPLTI